MILRLDDVNCKRVYLSILFIISTLFHVEKFHLFYIKQVGVGFNRDKWEHLERYARSLTKIYRNVYVCTGPLYLPRKDVDGKMYVK